MVGEEYRTQYGSDKRRRIEQNDITSIAEAEIDNAVRRPSTHLSALGQLLVQSTEVSPILDTAPFTEPFAPVDRGRVKATSSDETHRVCLGMVRF